MDMAEAEAAKDPARFTLLVEAIDTAKAFSELVEELASDRREGGYSSEDDESSEQMLKSPPTYSASYGIVGAGVELDRANTFVAQHYRGLHEKSPLIYEVHTFYNFGTRIVFRHTYEPLTFANHFQVLEGDWEIMEEGEEASAEFVQLIERIRTLREEGRLTKTTPENE